MRKALIGILMGATMVTPVAATAQNVDESGVTETRRERPARQEHRAQRQEQRVERQQARMERSAEQPQQERAQVRAQIRNEARSNDRAVNRQERVEARTEARTNVRVERARTWPGQQQREDRVINQARQEQQADRRGDRGNWGNNRGEVRTERRDNRQDWRTDRREDRADRRDDRRDWNRNWRNDNRYDWQRWRGSNRNIFRIGRYYSPYRNHNYSRFSIGFQLGSGFYSDRYWISDPWQYRLPPAYAGTRWVRYYDDVLLVDLYTGEVLDVIYDFFW
jgi:hypothetical protein